MILNDQVVENTILSNFVLFSVIIATPVSSGGYLMMGPVSGRSPGSNPIPIRAGKEPGMYMEMGPSSQPLPTVKESGSKWTVLYLLKSLFFEDLELNKNYFSEGKHYKVGTKSKRYYVECI